MYEANDSNEKIMGGRFDGFSTESDSTVTDEKTGLSWRSSKRGKSITAASIGLW